MRTGDLNRRIAFQVRAATKDSFGQQVTTWSTLLASVPANIAALAGRELLAAQAANAEVTHEITVRYHPKLANPTAVAAMRAVYVDVRHGITRVFELATARNVEEKNRWLVISASEGLTAG